MNDFKTLPELFSFIKEKYERSDLLNYRLNNAWKSLSTKEFSDSVENLALGLLNMGLKKGERVGIISNSSPFWVISDLAIILAGGITVPIFNRISPENLEFEIEDSGLNIIIVGDVKEYEPVRLYGKRVKKIITLGYKKDDPIAVSFEDVIESGRRCENKKDFLQNSIAQIKEDDLFTIIYTSGSMGIPKGVMLNHRNIISQIKAAAEAFTIQQENDKALSSLPLAHIFERMVMFFYLSRGIPVYFVDDLNKIGELIREVRPTIMTVVPRLLEKVYEKMRRSAEEEKGLKKAIALAAFNRAETKDVDEKPKGFKDYIYQKLVYSKLNAALGGNFRHIISGAASLPFDVGRFFINIGLPIYEGYGMTEASPVIAANRVEKHKLGTVGLPFPSVTIKIGGDGEILAKGPNVMLGYYHNAEETGKTLDREGYLHTGDLGQFDEDGFLKITGRKKELFKKSTGEYVPPVPIESALRKLHIVDTAIVIAEGRKFVSCLIFPDFDEIKRLKEQNGFFKMTVNEFLDSDYISKMTNDFIQEMNSHLHHTEEVQKFAIIKTPISIETGELTPTLKIRRETIEKKFKKEIDALYEN